MRINRDELLNKLEFLRAGLSPTEVVEQSSRIAFRGGRGYTYNEEITCRIRVPLDLTCAVAAEPLMALLRRIPDEEVDVSIRESSLRVSGKRVDAGVIMDASITMPIDSVERPNPKTWRPIGDEFSKAIDMVEGCGSSNGSIFILTCVHLTPKYVEACDNKKITRYRVSTQLKQKAVVRRDAIRKIVNQGMTAINETETWLHFKNPAGLVLSVRRYTEDYPPMRELLTVEGAPIELPMGLIASSELAAIFASENAEVKDVKIKLHGDRLTVRGEGPSGWLQKRHKVTGYTGPPIDFSISPAVLSEVLNKSNKCILNESRLKVDGGKWQFVSWLRNNQTQERTDEDRS